MAAVGEESSLTPRLLIVPSNSLNADSTHMKRKGLSRVMGEAFCLKLNLLTYVRLNAQGTNLLIYSCIRYVNESLILEFAHSA